MRCGAVLPFPHPRRLRDAERECLQRFVVAVPGARADILIGQGRREIAILTLVGRHFWIARNHTGIEARDAFNGHLIAKEPCISLLLPTMAAVLPPDRATCSGLPQVPHLAPCEPAKPPRSHTTPSQDDRP